jgi:4-amino-4-deoxy-L-arabinose transferase-like glycosyltransferase
MRWIVSTDDITGWVCTNKTRSGIMRYPEKTKNTMKLTLTHKDAIALAAVSFLVLVWNIWSGSLLSWDEAFYGAVSKEIFRTGDWINLYWAGMTWSDKPPLYMWATSFFYGAFGINEFSVRFFSVICGTGTVLAVYFLARELYSRRAALASALVLLTTWHFIWSSKVGMLDITLTFFITLSILFFQIGIRDRKFLFLSPLAFAMAFLTKGPGAIIIPIIIVLYAIFSGKTKKLFDSYILVGTAISAGIILWWHIAVFASYGEDFIKNYLFQHLVRRTTTAIEGHTGTFFTYFKAIPNKGRPWSMAGLILIPVAIFRIFRSHEKQHLLPVIWASLVILLFSAVQTKLHWYIIPVYPALALLTGWGLESILKKYTAPAAILLSLFSLVYLTADKGIFDLDYSPNIKETYLGISSDLPGEENLFLYDISDPGMQFYLGWRGINVRNQQTLNSAFKAPDSFILLSKRNLPRLPSKSYTVVSEYPDHILIKPEK